MTMTHRPTSVTVFGVLSIVFGALGLCSVVGAVAVMMNPIAGGPNNPAAQAINQGGFYGAYSLISMGLGSVAAIVLLASGIGLLRLRAWARKASIAYACYSILTTIVGLAVNYLYVLRPLADQLGTGGLQEAVAMGAMVGSGLGGVLGLVFPILLMYFMLRPHVAAAFGAGVGPFGHSALRPGPAVETGNPYQSPHE
jgi:hypothetical protein